MEADILIANFLFRYPVIKWIHRFDRMDSVNSMIEKFCMLIAVSTEIWFFEVGFTFGLITHVIHLAAPESPAYTQRD